MLSMSRGDSSLLVLQDENNYYLLPHMEEAQAGDRWVFNSTDKLTGLKIPYILNWDFPDRLQKKLCLKLIELKHRQYALDFPKSSTTETLMQQLDETERLFINAVVAGCSKADTKKLVELGVPWASDIRIIDVKDVSLPQGLYKVSKNKVDQLAFQHACLESIRKCINSLPVPARKEQVILSEVVPGKTLFHPFALQVNNLINFRSQEADDYTLNNVEQIIQQSQITFQPPLSKEEVDRQVNLFNEACRIKFFILQAKINNKRYEFEVYATNQEEAKGYAMDMLQIYSHTDIAELLEADREQKITAARPLAENTHQVDRVVLARAFSMLFEDKIDAPEDDADVPIPNSETTDEARRLYAIYYTSRAAGVKVVRENIMNIQLEVSRTLIGSDIKTFYPNGRIEEVGFAICIVREGLVDSIYLTKEYIHLRMEMMNNSRRSLQQDERPERILTNEEINNALLGGNRERIAPSYVGNYGHFWSSSSINDSQNAPALTQPEFRK